MPKWFVTVAASLLGLAALPWLLNGARSAGARDAQVVALEAVRVVPDPDVGEVVESALSRPVEFVYEIRNVGTERIRGLVLHPPEHCRIVEQPSETLPIGGKTRVAFVVRCFQTGTLETWIPVTADGSDSPPLVLVAVVSVPQRPPWLQQPPQTVRITVSSMQTASRQLRLETVERANSAEWISDLEVPSHLTDVIQVLAEPLEEQPYTEPGLCSRVYRFRITVSGIPPGFHGTMLRLVVRSPAEGVPRAIPLEVRVLDE